jgi:hypothetical protein
MNKFFTVLAALVAVSMMVPANAEECTIVTSSPQVDTDRDAPGVVDTVNDQAGAFPPGHHQFYVINDLCQVDLCGWSIWIYEETNGMAGLQRKDDFIGDDTCGQVAGDTIIF